MTNRILDLIVAGIEEGIKQRPKIDIDDLLAKYYGCKGKPKGVAKYEGV